MKPLVSIIIPVFQVEKYLDKCIASVVGQTYKNLQIILIDDGSTDRSPAICDGWKEQDLRITVIHQPNGGLSRARNAGLKLATGEFVGFVDSDDWIEPNMVECLLSALQETDVDIAVGGVREFTEDSKSIVYTQPKTSKRKVYSAEDALRRVFLLKDHMRDCVWNKLYRRTAISNITFPEGKIYEDVLWTARVIGNAKTVVCIDKILYHYLQRHDSLSRDPQLKIRSVLDKLEQLEQRIEYIHEQYPAIEKFAVMRLHNFCCREYLEFGSQYSYLDVDGKIRNELYKHFCKYRPCIIWDQRDLPKGIVRILLCFLPKVTCHFKCIL